MTAETAPALEVRLLQLALGGEPLLRDLHLRVPAGAVHTVMGPSGCGK